MSELFDDFDDIENAVADVTIRADANQADITAGASSVAGDIFLFTPDGDLGADATATAHEDAEPCAVLVINDGGRLEEGTKPYDRCVAGIGAGAGGLQLGSILRRDRSTRSAVALMGTAYCKFDARGDPIARGDLRTTSGTPGHVMRACDPEAVFGAVIGKALGTFQSGIGRVPILVALQWEVR